MSLNDVLGHKPIAEAIVVHLNFISRLSLCRVCPQLRDKIPIYLDFRRVVKQQLTRLLNDEHTAKQMLEIMQETQTWMSGSFVLKCLTGLDFDVGDLDLFTNNYISKFQKVYKWRHKVTRKHRTYKVCHPYISQFSNRMYRIGPFDTIERGGLNHSKTRVVVWHNGIDEDDAPSSAILYIRDFYVNKIKIQDIIIDKTFPIREYIDDVFDMGFLKSMFNGKTLRILDPESVLKQKSTVNMFQAYFKSFKHITGYEQPPVEVKSGFIRAQYKRIKKYRKRGFIVDVDFSKNVESVERLCRRWGDSEFKMTKKEMALWDYIVNEENHDDFEKSSEDEFEIVSLSDDDFYVYTMDTFSDEN